MRLIGFLVRWDLRESNPYIKMKEYGTPDEDKTAYNKLLEHLQGLEVNYILHYPRVPIDARACRMPQSLKVQAVLASGEVLTVVQPAPGRKAKLQ